MKYQILSFAFILAFISSISVSAQENKTLTIGNTEITFQSPIKVESRNQVIDTTLNTANSAKKNKKHTPYRYKRRFTDIYFGFGFATDGSFSGEKYMPVNFGPSIDIQTGLRFYYRPCHWYAVGTQIQYSYFNYKFRDVASNDRIIPDIPGTPFAEYYRTDNLGTAWLNRFYLCRKMYVELGLYGDWIMSKRYIVKTTVEEEERTYTYRNDELFSSFQAGFQASVGVKCFSIYAKYRMTDLFYRDKIANDPTRLNLGVMFSF